MMGLVLACGFGLAALKHPTPLLASFVYTGALTTLFFSILAALRGRHRTFWLGFAIVFSGYFAAAFVLNPSNGPNPIILSSRLFFYLFPRMGITWDREDALHGVAYDEFRGFETHSFENSPEWLAFARVGHSLAAIVHGIAGGVVIVLLERGAKRSGVRKEEPHSGSRPGS
jgi:hypothetical protein